MDSQNLFYAFDGDSIGIRHAEAILSDDPNNISHVSQEITAANEMVKEFVESHGGRMVSFGGDEGLFEAPAEFVNYLEELRKDYEYMVGATLSIGYGSKPSEAGKALLAAKEWGKDQVVQYDEHAEEVAQGVQEGRNSESNGKTDPSGQVLPTNADATQNEPTLCEPPVEDNNRGYDSGYKDSDPNDRRESYEAQDLVSPIIAKPNLTTKPPVEEAVCADVPESDRGMNNTMPDPKDKPAKDKKPAPKDYHGQAEGHSPVDSGMLPVVPEDKEAPESLTQPSEQKPSDLKYNSGRQGTPEPNMPIENATTDTAENTEEDHMLHCPTCTCDAHDEPSMEDIFDQHIENAKNFENVIGEGGNMGEGTGGGSEGGVDDTLDAHIENATDMQNEMDGNGISRPNDYDKKDEDMGLSEEEAGSDEPQLDEVLRDGLDAHADSIQREKVVNMVGEALEAFKNQKKILDKAKEQAPELHDACISMLKAMIELCSLAGIDESQAEQDVNEIEGQGEAPEEIPGAEGQQTEEQQPEDHEESCPTCGKPSEEEFEEQPAAPGGAAPFPKK